MADIMLKEASDDVESVISTWLPDSGDFSIISGSKP